MPLLSILPNLCLSPEAAPAEGIPQVLDLKGQLWNQSTAPSIGRSLPVTLGAIKKRVKFTLFPFFPCKEPVNGLAELPANGKEHRRSGLL